MKINYNKSRIMKMAHVRRNVDKVMFGCVKDDFAYYLRGAWATAKQDHIKACEELRMAEVRRNNPSNQNHSESFIQGCMEYYASAPRRAYFGD